MNNAQGCMHCGQLVEPYEISRETVESEQRWYVRYYCKDDNRQWKSRIVEWTETLRAEWLRENVLSDLVAPASATPWIVAE